MGTLCTIVMDLANQVIHLKKGHTSETDFLLYGL
jgi:hypothetical protein